MEADVVDALAGAPAHIRRIAMMRYAGQAFELPVPLPAHDLARPHLFALAAAFETEHERSYGHRLVDADGIEIIAIEVIATAIARQPDVPRLATQAPARQADRAAYFGPDLGICTTPVVHRRDLGDTAAPGPLIVEEYEGTTVVPPACQARLDANDNIVIELAA